MSLPGSQPDAARLERARSFGAAAREYERGRPPYPDAALDWLVPPGAKQVLDVGAGTGKLTRQLERRGLDVVAVEPSPGMRVQLTAESPGVTVLAGTAESIPLPDSSVDLVACAQAWHWVDPARAVPEAARVLRPGGTLGLVWNVRDERTGWVAELGGLMHRRGEDDSGPAPAVGPPFGPLERHDVAWEYTLTRDAVLDLVASRSYVITLDGDERARLLDEVRDLVATIPVSGNDETLTLPYVTQCYRARLVA